MLYYCPGLKEKYVYNATNHVLNPQAEGFNTSAFEIFFSKFKIVKLISSFSRV